ncbi:competence/damage-inducible protein A [bacterium]|jgi:nicotinamide-nucleotide amidase|nr:competence/damage-inducible protein A [bacterium]
MKAEIISIGSELTSGKNLDTNSQWLSIQLASMGIPVGWHTTIADDFDANLEAFGIASQRAGLVVATGGLGPTQDDLTREVLAKLLKVPLEFHQPSWDTIIEMFTRRNRACPDRNKVQAYFPKGAEPIPNTTGTAPGIWVKVNQSYFAALPGVPREMKSMFDGWLKPKLLGMGMSQGVLIQRKINTFGLGESAIEEKLFDITRRGNDPEVGITASDAVISLRILAGAENEALALKKIAPAEAIIRERLGELVFGVEDEELQDVVHQMLQKFGKTIATAESITGGLLASRFTKVPGASARYLGGFVTYTNDVKKSALGVPAELLDQFGACSKEVTLAMAEGCRERTGADFALATTGVAGPGDLSPELREGKVFVALAWKGGSQSETNQWFGSRHEVQSRTAKMALNMLRLHLLRELKHG